MAIEVWNPFEDLTELSRSFRRSMKSMAGIWMPSVNVYSKDNNLIVEAELPGVNKNDIHVDVTNKTLVISGERKNEEKVEEDNYYRMETSYGKFSRSISLPDEVKLENIQAVFKNGILKVTVPGAGKEMPKKMEVEIKEEAA